MSLSYYNPHDRYRKRAADRVGGFILAFVLLSLIFGVGFWLGGERAGHGEKTLKVRVNDLEAQNQTLEQTLVDVRSEAQTAVMRFEQLQKTYAEQVPEGPVEDLLALVRKQLEEGRDPERLAFLIRSARPPRNCSEIETKRFVVSTPANQGPDSQVSIADGSIVIKGSGISARNAENKPEAWFDPSKTVKVEFVQLGGQKETKTGIFPLHHSIVLGGREYRFTITDGARSFAKVTFDSCDYP